MLHLTIQSFSYKKHGIPADPSGNGGGFVFDCRFLHNPGRYAPYKNQTGLDAPVITFLQKESEIDTFLESVFTIVDAAINNYIERNFTHLMVSFGCTGGQHRSVYAAEALHRHVTEKYPIRTTLHHLERDSWPTPNA